MTPRPRFDSDQIIVTCLPRNAKNPPERLERDTGKMPVLRSKITSTRKPIAAALEEISRTPLISSENL